MGINIFKRWTVRINRLEMMSNTCVYVYIDGIIYIRWSVEGNYVTIFHYRFTKPIWSHPNWAVCIWRTKVTFPRASFVICFTYLFINSVCHSLVFSSHSFVVSLVDFNKRLTTAITDTSKAIETICEFHLHLYSLTNANKMAEYWIVRFWIFFYISIDYFLIFPRWNYTNSLIGFDILLICGRWLWIISYKSILYYISVCDSFKAAWIALWLCD